MSISRINY